MLELPSASASASPPNQSTGAAIRHVDRQDAGFQGRLREVLGSQDAQQPAGRNQAEAKRAQPSDTAKGMEEGVHQVGVGDLLRQNKQVGQEGSDLTFPLLSNLIYQLISKSINQSINQSQSTIQNFNQKLILRHNE